MPCKTAAPEVVPSLDALSADLDRFTFLLGGGDGEDLFGRQ